MIKNKLTLWSKVRVQSDLILICNTPPCPNKVHIPTKYEVTRDKKIKTKRFMYDKKKKSNLFTLWSTVKVTVTTFSCLKTYNTGANPGFQVREGALKKITPSGGRRKICWGISCEKSRFYAKKNHIFSNFRGRGGGTCWVCPPLDPPL